MKRREGGYTILTLVLTVCMLSLFCYALYLQGPYAQLAVPILFAYFATFIYITLYFLPSIIALEKKRHNAKNIFYINLFLGWTVLGWGIACVSACRKDKE